MSFQSVEPNQIPDGATVVDVREQNEWDAGHAEGALHIPSSELMGRYGEIPEGEFYVVCRAGGRSYQASQWLESIGFEPVNVSGGMGRWIEQNLPIVADGPEEPYIL